MSIPFIRKAAMIAALVTTGWAGLASAHDTSECERIEAAEDRLACYDAFAAPSDNDPASFGGEQLEERSVANRASTLEAISAVVTAIIKPKGRAAVITLDNEQVWRQVSSRYARLEEGDRVTIRASRFGGYILANERGVTMRVRRDR